MATSYDQRLCNSVPLDHRLQRFLSSASRQQCRGVGNHAEIVKQFGNSMVRLDGSFPSENEAAFAAWLAKPDTKGGLVVALLQPAKSQDYNLDFQQVKEKCRTLDYLDQSLSFLHGPGGFATTSVFDAFPFITEPISSGQLTKDENDAYQTFFAMLESKRPDVVFACWRVYRQDLDFSGKGLGQTKAVGNIRLSNGHIVRVVNGFHPSYAVNFWPNESCFRRLFIMELCKAFCELDSSWEEEKWMEILRWNCQKRTRQLKKG
jgi:hypothetical protein